MTDYREILRLRSIGISLRGIAEFLQCSKQTVITVCRKADEAVLSWPLPDNMTNEALASFFWFLQKPSILLFYKIDCFYVFQTQFM